VCLLLECGIQVWAWQLLRLEIAEAQGQGLRALAFASFWQTGDFASAIWKFLSAFALACIHGAFLQ
jgi:hypothetical protein